MLWRRLFERKIASLWTGAWMRACERPELEGRIRRAQELEAAEDVAPTLEQESREHTLRRLHSEIEAYRAIFREFARNAAISAGLLALAAALAVVPWLLIEARWAKALYVAAYAAFLGGGGVAGSMVDGRKRRRRALERLDAKLDSVLLPHLRRQLSRRLRVSFACLETSDLVGLSEVVDASLEVTTQARDRLAQLFESMRSGCIGISGARGAGKSTLIRAARDGRLTPDDLPPTLGVNVAAPVKWKASEFVPFLFSRLCATVAPWLDEGGLEPRLRTRRRAWTAVAAFGTTALLVYASLRIERGEPVVHASRQDLLQFALLAGATVTYTTGLMLAVLASTRSSRQAPLTLLARQRMLELRYRTTVVEGWSVTAAPSKLLSLGRKREATATQQPMTLPEVVGSYKAFVDRVAAEHTLVIGIDELDKMDSAEHAARFLRDVKVLFGEQRCLYLVSISDEAMSEFERRGLPVRDVFDSSFDDVLHVEALSYAESHEIVNGRVVGMGDAFVALCYVISGGVPRELIRCVRAVVAAHGSCAPPDGEGTAADAPTPARVAQLVTVERMERIERAVRTVASRHVAANGAHPLLTWLDGLPAVAPETLAARWDVAAPYAALAAHPMPPEDRDAQRLLLLELAVAAYRAVATNDLWQRLTAPMLDSLTDPSAAAPSGFTLLARSWQDLQTGPLVAWRTVTAARRALELEGEADFPLPESRVPLWKRVLPPAVANGGAAA